MMTRWLPEHESCNIPNYAHTMLAVGAVVINKHNEVLIVKEKYFLTSHWKFPGGIVEPGKIKFTFNRQLCKIAITFLKVRI